jgi:hypothetical protein
VDISPGQVREGVKLVRVDNVLRLDQESVVHHLGVNKMNQLKLPRHHAEAYELTQIIGHAAFKAGYRAVVAPSAVVAEKRTLHYLRP